MKNIKNSTKINTTTRQPVSQDTPHPKTAEENTDDEEEDDLTLMGSLVDEMQSMRLEMFNSIKILAAEQKKIKEELQQVKSEDYPPRYQHAEIKLYDLPLFHGAADEWPMFEASFYETTEAFGYKPFDNMLRLRKALKDDASRRSRCCSHVLNLWIKSWRD